MTPACATCWRGLPISPRGTITSGLRRKRIPIRFSHDRSMPRFDHDRPAAPGLPQVLRMTEEGRLIGSACWHAPADSADGVVQILDFQVVAAFQRRGHGKRMLAAAIDLWTKH